MCLRCLCRIHVNAHRLLSHSHATHLISGSVHELLKDPGLRDWLEEDWSRANLAVEEFLRFISPVQSPSRASCGRTSSLAVSG
jgi:cytochrome P450